MLEGIKRPVSPAETAGTLDKLDQQRSQILAGIQAQLKVLAKDQEPLVKGLSESARGVGDKALVGGLLTGIGAIIGFATKIVIIDVTGGVLAAVGLLLGGFALVWKRGKIIDQFSDGMKKGKQFFARELRDKLNSDLRGIYTSLDRNFLGLDTILAECEKELQPRLQTLDEVRKQIDSIQRRVLELKEKT